MPYVIGLLILIVLLLIFGPIIAYLILLMLGVAGVTFLAVVLWVLKKLIWVAVGLLVLFVVAFVVMWLIDPKGMEAAMKEADEAKRRRDAYNATFKTSSFKKGK